MNPRNLKVKKRGDILVPASFNTDQEIKDADELAAKIKESQAKQQAIIDRYIQKMLVAVLPPSVVYLMSEHSKTPDGPKDNARMLHYLRIEVKLSSTPYGNEEGDIFGNLRKFRMIVTPNLRYAKPIEVGELRIVPIKDEKGMRLNFTSKVNAEAPDFAPSHPNIRDWLKNVKHPLAQEILQWGLDPEKMKEIDRQYAPLYSWVTSPPTPAPPAQENAPYVNPERINDGPATSSDAGSEPQV